MPQHATAVEQRGVDGHEQAVHVKDRQRVDQHVAALLRRSPTPVFLQHHGVGQQVAVRQHGALAAAGGAAGVQDGRQVIGPTLHRLLLVAAMRGALQQAAAAVVVQREHVARASLKGDLADPGEVAAAAHHHGRLGVADEVLDLGALVGRVQRQEGEARAQRGQVQDHGLDRFFHLHRHARRRTAGVRLDGQRGQQVGDHGAGAVEVAPRIAQAVVGLDGHGVQIGREGGAQGGEQVLVGHGGQARVDGQKRAGRFCRKAAMPSRCSALSA